MQRLKILIGEISSYKAIVIAKYINEFYPEYDLIGYDDRRFTATIHTKYCIEIIQVISSKIDRAGHISDLVNCINCKQIDFFIPVDSETYGDYIDNKNKFGRAFNYVGDLETYTNLHDKTRFSALATKEGIRTPKEFHSFSEAELPFVVKPTNMSSAKGVKYFFNEKQRKDFHFEYKLSYVIQEFVQGVGCGYSVFAKDGSIVAGHGHLRLAEYPVTGGSSVYRASFNNQEMKEIVTKLLLVTKWSGFVMFEFKLTSDDELILIEANPRVWGSINQGLQCGANYLEGILGKAKAVQTSQRYTYLSPLVYKALLKYLFRFQLKPLLLFLRNIHKNKADISLLDDFKGYLSTILRKIL